jgi:thiamine biosynthesis lipoprotein
MAGVTVVAPLCLLAGTAATVAMLQGENGAPAWLKEMGLPHLWTDQAGMLGGDLVPKD